jgi:drug/metabolite transporter (DMT)-like permease
MGLNKVVLIGSLFVILGEFFFVAMGMLVKALADDIPNLHLVFYRNLFAAIICIPLIYRAGFNNFKTKRINIHLIRSVCGVSAMYCFFYALANIELANAMLLKMTGPIFIPIVAVLWLRELVSLRTITAILIGFAGVVIFLNPSKEIQTAAVIGLLGGALAATAKVAIRKMSDTEPTARIVFYFATLSALISVIPVLLGSAFRPDTEQFSLLLLLAVLGTCGQLCLTKAYNLAPASQVGAFTYTSLLWASIAGWFFWDEFPSIETYIGASLIIFAGIILIYRNKKRTQTS